MRSGPGRGYVYRSAAHGGWMVVEASGQHEFGPYRWRWVASFFLWCIDGE
jgi:hypothetical protein